MACYTPSMRMTLFFNRMVFQNSGAVVSSLSVADDSASILSLVCKDTGLPDNTGHLELGIDLGFAAEGTDSALSTAFKELNATTKALKSGPILSGLKAGGSNVLLSGGVAGAVGSAFEGYRYGLVTITLVENVVGGELPVDVIQLNGVTEESFQGLLAVGFPAGKPTSYRGRIRIPLVSGVSSMTVVWRGWIFGKSAGDMPPLEMTIRKISRPSPTTTPANAPLVDAAHVLDTTALGTYTTNQYAELESDPITVAPGDTLLFTITRPSGDDGSGDDYDDEIHVITQYAAITGST